MTETLLTIQGVGIPSYSARGITQTLEPIDGSMVYRRTVNGELIDLSEQQFRKYRSQIQCEDVNPPAIDGVWPGLQVIVECVAELSHPASGAPSRTPVQDSIRQVGDYIFYRPVMTMRITAFNVERDEYGGTVKWSMALEEV